MHFQFCISWQLHVTKWETQVTFLVVGLSKVPRIPLTLAVFVTFARILLSSTMHLETELWLPVFGTQERLRLLLFPQTVQSKSVASPLFCSEI